MKLLYGIALLCLSALWATFWCAQVSDPLLTDYQVVFVLVASLALIPVFWATSLIDQAWRAPLAPATRPILVMARKPRIEAEAERDDQPAALEESSPELPAVNVADVIAETESPTPKLSIG